MSIRIEDWAIVVRGDGYTPPECLALCVEGIVFGHPLQPDGKHIVTSRVVDVDEENQIVTTTSGSKYHLGKPSDKYAEYCKSIGKEVKMRVINKCD